VSEPWIGYLFPIPADSAPPSFQSEQPAAFNFPSPRMR
jgi:hypothetical protein